MCQVPRALILDLQVLRSRLQVFRPHDQVQYQYRLSVEHTVQLSTCTTLSLLCICRQFLSSQDCSPGWTLFIVSTLFSSAFHCLQLPSHCDHTRFLSSRLTVAALLLQINVSRQSFHANIHQIVIMCVGGAYLCH